jgi:hypothetical protein
MRSVLRIALIVIGLTLVCAAQGPVVNTASGPVRGIGYEKYNSFLGIPFAAPPVGELRFADPKPAASWAPNTLEVTSFRPGTGILQSVQSDIF